MPADSSSGPAAAAAALVAATSPYAKGKAGLKRQAEELYEKCCSAQPLGHAFSLAELSELVDSDDDQQLLDLAERLIDESLFVLCRSIDGQNEASWKARDRKQAEMYAFIG
jgi:hypothetical protein